ncbi:MAG: hypothetical protein AAGU11_03255 [Syntrophobacteraceae bacterium]
MEQILGLKAESERKNPFRSKGDRFAGLYYSACKKICVASSEQYKPALIDMVAIGNVAGWEE